MAAASDSNKKLFLQLGTGDETAFRMLFDAYRHSFYAAAFKLTRSAHTAEEIVQDVFVTLWEKRSQVAAARNPFAYLVTILHNKIYSHFRNVLLERQARQKAGSTESRDETSVEELLLQKEHRELLETVIHKLPPQQQLVYRLSKQEGLSREEIAQKLDLSANTVRNHLAASVAFIRAYLKGHISVIIWIVLVEQL